MGVYIKNGEDVVTSCGTITEEQDIYTFDCEGVGDTVELWSEPWIQEQNIAEIMVYGDPDIDPGKFSVPIILTSK